jgi:hypothetical protein
MNARTFAVVVWFLGLMLITLGFAGSPPAGPAWAGSEGELSGGDSETTGAERPYVQSYQLLRVDRGVDGESTDVVVWVNPEGTHYGAPVKSLEFTDASGDSYEFEAEELFDAATDPHYRIELPYRLPEGELEFTIYDAEDFPVEFRLSDAEAPDARRRLEAASYTGDFKGVNSQGSAVTLSVDVASLEIKSSFRLTGPLCSVTTDITWKGTISGNSFSFGGMSPDEKVKGSHNAKADKWSGDWSLYNSNCIARGTFTWSAGRYYRPVQVSQMTPSNGTSGTEVELTGSGFGSKKGKITVGGAKTKILSWGTTAVRFLLNKAPEPGEHDLVIQPKEPKGVTLTLLDNYFTVKAPEIQSLDKTQGSAGESVSVVANFVGTKKGKVSLVDPGGNPRKCKVLSWTMDARTNAGLIVFAVPKKTYGQCDLVITTKAGSTTVPDVFNVN